MERDCFVASLLAMTPPSVVASAAKQTGGPPGKKARLLRRYTPRKDTPLSSLRAERSNLRGLPREKRDCFVASLLAMTLPFLSLRAQRSNLRGLPRGERRGMKRDCFVAALLAMTDEKGPRKDAPNKVLAMRPPPSLRAERSKPRGLPGRKRDCFVVTLLARTPPFRRCERSEATSGASRGRTEIVSSLRSSQ